MIFPLCTRLRSDQESGYPDVAGIQILLDFAAHHNALGSGFLIRDCDTTSFDGMKPGELRREELPRRTRAERVKKRRAAERRLENRPPAAGSKSPAQGAHVNMSVGAATNSDQSADAAGFSNTSSTRRFILRPSFVRLSYSKDLPRPCACMRSAATPFSSKNALTASARRCERSAL